MFEVSWRNLAERRERARRQLEDHPMCRWCSAQAKVSVAVVTDYSGYPSDNDAPLELLCRDCYDFKRARPVNAACGLDGYPLDGRHPFNRPRPSRRPAL